MVTVPIESPVVVGANFTERARLCDGLSLVDPLTPLTLKPLPATVTPEMSAAAFPVLLKVTCCVLKLPLVTVPKFKFVALIFNCATGVDDPVPFSATLVVGFVGSLLVIPMVPLALPAAVGEKLTVTGTLCPELIVFGVVIPLMPNSAPFNVTTDTARSEPPVFDNTRVLIPFVPIDTLPKSTVALLTDNWGCGVTTLPARLATTEEDPESPRKVKVPLTLPTLAAVSQTLKPAVCPGGSTAGRLKPVIPNCPLEKDIC
jgi:hypothetical protein